MCVCAHAHMFACMPVSPHSAEPELPGKGVAGKLLPERGGGEGIILKLPRDPFMRGDQHYWLGRALKEGQQWHNSDLGYTCL